MAEPTAVNTGHAGANQDLSITGVIGTLGTADTAGTALTLPIGVNASTGAMFVQDLSGASGTTNVLVVGGTLTSVTNLAGGTAQINPVPVPTMLTFGTLGTAGGSFFATISAASGAGTKHYISGVDIIMGSGTADVRVLAGSSIQGTGVLAAGNFPAGGGISPVFNPAFATGTNSEILYHFVGAGTAFITTRYWKGA